MCAALEPHRESSSTRFTGEKQKAVNTELESSEGSNPHCFDSALLAMTR